MVFNGSSRDNGGAARPAVWRGSGCWSEKVALTHKPTLREFADRRLGNPEGARSAARSMFARSFGARSFAAFWRYWNPVYHYYLHYWVYRPLHRFLPRPIAILLTFAVCGFLLHDLPVGVFTRVPLITVWFLFLGAGGIVGEALRMDLSHQPFAARVMVNVIYLVGIFEVARRVAPRSFGL